MIYGITGATGQLGRIVVEKLVGKVGSEQVLALVRNPDKASDLGVPARAFDYGHADTLAAALSGVDVLLLISSNEIGARQAQHKNVIDAAKAAGVKRILYTSLLHADRSPISLAEDHLSTEAHLKASGVPYTLLRNGWYTENYAGSIGAAAAHGALVGSVGEGKLSTAAREDYAEAAAVALVSEGLENETLELAGDESYTFADLAAEISKQTGKQIPYNNLPEAEYAALLASHGLPEFLAQAIAGWDTGAAQGGLFDDSRTMSKLIGRPTTPVSVSVAGILKG